LRGLEEGIEKESRDAMSDKETAFLGKITAGMTHEFMNVLATIGQTSGLMEDLLILCQETSFPHQDKFTQILTKIKTQVSRGSEIGTRLKDFAHSMDEKYTRVDVNELMEQVVFIMNRFANLKKMELHFKPVESELSIDVDLFRVEMAIAKCIEKCIEYAAHGDAIRLQFKNDPGAIGFQVFVVSDSNIDSHAMADDLLEIEETLASLGARIKAIVSPPSAGLDLVLSS
jgi:signal transduction histidine kinase